MKNTFSAVKSGRAGDCSKECELAIKTHPDDVSLRWRKNKYGGIIHMNYSPTHPDEVTFAGKAYKGVGTVTIDFLNHAGLTVDNVDPDAVVHMEFIRGGSDNAEIIHILAPFVAVGDQGSFPITDGSELIHKVTTQLKTYQPSEDDSSTQLTDINVSDFIPSDDDYYYAVSNSGDKYIILRKIQGIKSEDKNTLFEDLFKIGSSPKWASHGGTNLDIAKYYTSAQKINISNVHRHETHEGFTGMNIMMTPLNTSIYEGFASSKGDDEVYIDCRPVGVDEETKPVTVKHERRGMFDTENGEMLRSLLVVMLGAVLFCAILFGIFKLLKTQDAS
jgi:hypothetical protein